MCRFEVQGHRGARALRPENTLPSFETAISLGVHSIETDVFTTRDGVPVLIHDPFLEGRPITDYTLAELRRFRVDQNPDPGRFPKQRNDPTPEAVAFANNLGVDPYGIPTLAEFIAFARYLGKEILFDVEIKKTPLYPELQGVDVERRVVEVLENERALKQARVRSFDHRSLLLVRELAPELETAVLIAEAVPVDPVAMTRAAGATIYCPSYRHVDRDLVNRCHDGGVRVIPWTVNDPVEWGRLVSFGVDGITTDDPGLVETSQ